MSRQTAIQSLIEDIKIGTLSDHIDGVEYFSKDTILELLENAKETERDQIVDAWHSSHVSTMTGEQYYEETYKK